MVYNWGSYEPFVDLAESKDRKRLAWRCVISKGLAWGQMRWDRALKDKKPDLQEYSQSLHQAPNWEIQKGCYWEKHLNAISPQPANHSRDQVYHNIFHIPLTFRVLMRTRAWGWKKILEEVRCHKKDYLEALAQKAQEERIRFSGDGFAECQEWKKRNRIRCNIHPTDIIDTPHLEWDTS